MTIELARGNVTDSMSSQKRHNLSGRRKLVVIAERSQIAVRDAEELRRTLMDHRQRWRGYSEDSDLFNSRTTTERGLAHEAMNRLSDYDLLLAWTQFISAQNFLNCNPQLTYEQVEKLQPSFERPTENSRRAPDQCWPTFDDGVPVFSPYAATKKSKCRKARSQRSQLSWNGRKLDVCALAWRFVCRFHTSTSLIAASRVVNKGEKLPPGRKMELSHTMYIVKQRGATERNVLSLVLESSKTNQSR